MPGRIRDLTIATAGTIGSRVAWFVALPLIARLYSPADVGAWPLISAVGAIIAMFGNLRCDLAIAFARNRARARTLAFMVSALTLVIAIMVSAVISIFPGATGQLLQLSDSRILLVCPVYAVMFNASVILQAWLLREKQISAIALANAT